MRRALVEDSNALSIFMLKKFGDLRYYCKEGIMTWTNRDESMSRISYTLLKDCTDNNDHIELRYSQTDYWSGEKKDFNYKIWLTSTRCHFGGKRYWFICPVGHGCGSRVGVLYSVGGYFVCRRCGNLAYWKQAFSKRQRYCFVSWPELEKAESEVNREYYDGKMTRKYKRLMKLVHKESGFALREAESLGMNVEKLRKELREGGALDE